MRQKGHRSTSSLICGSSEGFNSLTSQQHRAMFSECGVIRNSSCNVDPGKGTCAQRGLNTEYKVKIFKIFKKS